MGFLDRLLGRTHDDRQFHGVPGQPGAAPPRPGEAPGKHGYGPDPDASPGQAPGAGPAYGQTTGHAARAGSVSDPDAVAIERYRYLLRTAPPDAVELAHAEAFARLTPEQRRRVLDDLGAAVPPAERTATDDPRSLARMATRAELRHPGTLEQSFRSSPRGPDRSGPDGARPGPGFGSMVGSSLLGTVAGVVIGSAVANALFGPTFGDPSQAFAADGGGDAGDASGSDGGGSDGSTGDGSADAGYTEASADDGGGFFDGGGDFGGGDFGGF